MKITDKITARYTWRVWLMPWYIVIVAVGVTTVLAGPWIGGLVYVTLASVSAGSAIGLAVGHLAGVVRAIKMERLSLYMPAQIEMLERTDEGQVLSVTRGNGENVIVTLPPDYHPSQDGMYKLVEAACPDMPESLRASWKNAAVEHALQRLLNEERE